MSGQIATPARTAEDRRKVCSVYWASSFGKGVLPVREDNQENVREQPVCLMARRSIFLPDNVILPNEFIERLRAQAGCQRSFLLELFVHGMIKEVHRFDYISSELTQKLRYQLSFFANFTILRKEKEPSHEKNIQMMGILIIGSSVAPSTCRAPHNHFAPTLPAKRLLL
jgi:uncharacterized membrane protein